MKINKRSFLYEVSFNYACLNFLEENQDVKIQEK